MSERCSRCGEELYDKHEPSPDWGAGPGTTYYGREKCPCGSGCRTWKLDDIPGFRDSSYGSCCNPNCPE